MKSKVVVVVSGGLDSAVLLHTHVKNGDEVRAISVDYGQRHRRELVFARKMTHLLQVPHVVANFSQLASILPGSSQTDEHVDVPEGHYTAETMKLTVVPNRNMILLAVAAGHAIAHKFDYISYAAHAGDHAIYPDCREEFVVALDKAIQLADEHIVRIRRPFIGLGKAEIVRRGLGLNVVFEDTYSCYTGDPVHCGKCGTCIERREAFFLAQVPDPTPYLDKRAIGEVLQAFGRVEQSSK